MTLDWSTAAGAGVVGALVMSVMTDVSRLAGIIDANLSRYQGCILIGRSDGAMPLIAGLAMHLAVGAALAIGYALIFSLVWGNATILGGILVGAVHGLAAGAGFPILDKINPCVQDGRIRAFGPFGRGYGIMMIVGLFAGHLVFGAIVGWLYTVPPL